MASVAMRHIAFIAPTFVVDRDAHQVLCFRPRGTLLFSLGERHRPRWEAPFNHPTEVALASDGDILMADGYGDGRVHRFDCGGTLRGSFGAIGVGPGAFLTPHSILVDGEDRVLVYDRENDRVQVITRDGRWVTSWDGLCRPMDLGNLPDGTVLVTDQVPSLTAFTPDGTRRGRAPPFAERRPRNCGFAGRHAVSGRDRTDRRLAADPELR